MTDLDSLQKLCEAATPGPWWIKRPFGDDGDADCFSDDDTWIMARETHAPDDDPQEASIAAIRRGCEEIGGEVENQADAAFIAAARTAMPELIRELKRAREAQAEADYYLGELNKLWAIAMPSRRGHYKRGLGDEVLNLAADACTYRERQKVVAIAAGKGEANG